MIRLWTKYVTKTLENVCVWIDFLVIDVKLVSKVKHKNIRYVSEVWQFFLFGLADGL